MWRFSIETQLDQSNILGNNKIQLNIAPFEFFDRIVLLFNDIISSIKIFRLYDKYSSLLSGEADREKEEFLNSKDGAPLAKFKEKMDG